jgi:hypothetical protein
LFKACAVTASDQSKHGKIFGSIARRLPHFARNDSSAFSESKESKTQEGRMDSRLRGNDSSHLE